MSLPEELVPVTTAQAAAKLDRKPVTIRVWAARYGARRLGSDPMDKRRVFYDFMDLAVIEREIRHGHPVPATWQERAEIRFACPLLEAERTFPTAA